MIEIYLIVFIILGILYYNSKNNKNEIRPLSRREKYNNVYLNSPEWKRKRYLVMKRDNWTFQKCQSKATEVHHLKYARNISKEPLDWLIAICNNCHRNIHNK